MEKYSLLTKLAKCTLNIALAKFPASRGRKERLSRSKLK